MFSLLSLILTRIWKSCLKPSSRNLFRFSRFLADFPAFTEQQTLENFRYNLLKKSPPTNFFKGLVAWCYSFCLFLKFYSAYRTFIRRHSLCFLSISSLLVSSVGKTSLGCWAEYRTRACLIASRRTTKFVTPQPFLVTPHPESLKLERVFVRTIKNIC